MRRGASSCQPRDGGAVATAAARQRRGGGSGSGGWRGARTTPSGAPTGFAAGALAVALALAAPRSSLAKDAEAGVDARGGEAGGVEASSGGALPVYTKAEVAEHKTRESRVWVTYKSGVYDVTEWLSVHPGGEARIMMAAGGAIDPYWAMFRQHDTPQVRGILESYRVGDLDPAEAAAAAAAAAAAREAGSDDPYRDEPTDRLPALIVRTAKPMNAETPPELLADSLLTPTPAFYVRNHLPVPNLDPETHEIVFEGEGLYEPVVLTAGELRRTFPPVTVTAVVQCTGNRRTELNPVREVKGLAWNGGAIGCATWTGALLSDVLEWVYEEDARRAAARGGGGDGGGDEGGARGGGGGGRDSRVSRLHLEGAIRHVIFTGADEDGAGEGYGASIPAHRALDRRADVLLAYDMNGEALTRDHGAPVRALVPGTSGCRSVKWLNRVDASREEAQTLWQQKDYKAFSPSVDWDEVDWSRAPAVQAMPVTSLLVEPRSGGRVAPEEADPDLVPREARYPAGTLFVPVRGYAWSGGGAKVIRVDVTATDGEDWTTAELESNEPEPGKAWGWTLFRARVPVPNSHLGCPPGTRVTLRVKATDDNYNTQPERPEGIWNLRGILCNSWHTIEVEVADEEEEDDDDDAAAPAAE